MDVIKPIFGRVGGKARLAPWIIEFIKQHQFSIYCEPFAGSAAVYFRMVSEGIFEEIKQRGHHPRIVLNDADSKIVQLFRVCRDHPELLAHAVRYTPYSREEHRIAQGKQDVETGDLDEIMADIEQARRSLVDSWMSFSRDTGRSWSIKKYLEWDRARESTEQFNQLPDRILAASPHLQNNEAKVQALELAKVLLDLAGSETDEETIKQQVEQARRSLVDSWMSFKYMQGDSWGTSTGLRQTKGSDRCESETFTHLPDRILAASPHLQNNEAKVQALELAKVLLDLAGSETDEETIKQQVEQARRSLVDSWMSFKYMPGDIWGIKKYLEFNRVKEAPEIFNQVCDRINKATNHLKRCYIENDDAVNVIKRWATPYTLFYLDPPYINCENYYAHNSNQTKDENLQLHYKLAEIANTVECAGVIVSYYPNELLDELYPEENWERHYKETIASSCGVTRTSKNRTKPKRMELLLVRKNRSESVDKPKSNYTGQLDLF